jgi:hypothetical protein
VSAFFELPDGAPFDGPAAVIRCVEEGAGALLLDRAVLPAAFFDLRTGVAGELAQKLVNYGLRMAAVVPDLSAQPPRFREFAREANAGGQLRFFATRQEAVAWLESR